MKAVQALNWIIDAPRNAAGWIKPPLYSSPRTRGIHSHSRFRDIPVPCYNVTIPQKEKKFISLSCQYKPPTKPIINSTKPKPIMIPSPIPVLRTTFISAVTAVTVYITRHNRHKPLLAAPLPATIGSSFSDEEVEYMESAKSVFTEIIKRNPILFKAYLALQDYYTSPSDIRDMIKEAIDSEDMKFADAETFVGFMLMYAFYHEFSWNYQESCRIYEGLLSKYPRDHRVYLCKGVLHAKLMEKEEADKCFDKYLCLVPKDDPHKKMLDDYMFKTKAYVAQLEF